jgi:hypothetical protein
MCHVPEAVALYSQLGVKKEPLGLIPPAFEAPLPPLTPATFPPVLREPLPPPLELFDLDEAFAGEQVRVCWGAWWSGLLFNGAGRALSAVPRTLHVGCNPCLPPAQSQLAALVAKARGPDDLEFFLTEAAGLTGLDAPPEGGAKVGGGGCCGILGEAGGLTQGGSQTTESPPSVVLALTACLPAGRAG